MIRVLVLLCGFAASSLSQAQALADSSQLRGLWVINGGRNSESLMFAADDEFVYSYSFVSGSASGATPTHRQAVGAYHVQAGVCSVGAEKGNLWLVLDSRRCCFTAYAMQRTIVLDTVGTSMSRVPELCGNKTLRRAAE